MIWSFFFMKIFSILQMFIIFTLTNIAKEIQCQLLYTFSIKLIFNYLKIEILCIELGMKVRKIWIAWQKVEEEPGGQGGGFYDFSTNLFDFSLWIPFGRQFLLFDLIPWFSTLSLPQLNVHHKIKVSFNFWNNFVKVRKNLDFDLIPWVGESGSERSSSSTVSYILVFGSSS